MTVETSVENQRAHTSACSDSTAKPFSLNALCRHRASSPRHVRSASTALHGDSRFELHLFDWARTTLGSSRKGLGASEFVRTSSGAAVTTFRSSSRTSAPAGRSCARFCRSVTRSNPPAAAASGGAVSAGAADTASLCRFLMRWLVGGGEGKGRGAAGVGESGAVKSAKAARRWERSAEGSGRRRARRAAGRHACRLRPATPNCRNALSHSERSGAHRR